MKPQDDPNWERKTITELAWEGLKEQKRSRRWRIFFQFLFAIYFLVFLLTLIDWPSMSEEGGKEHTALVELNGVISQGSDASAEKMRKSLRSAFKSKDSKGVILEINSPGGTPVQAASIYDELLRLQEEYPEKKLIAVVSDLCASGGYYVAAAASEIYASRSSIVGSIGVRMDSYGVSELAEKIGIESRTITAGENKALLDPFSPVNPEQRAHVQSMLGDVHQEFIKAVKDGRGERLKPNDKLYSGLIWSGVKAKELGLIDGFGDRDYVARELIGTERIMTYAPEKTLLEQLTEGVGTVMASSLQRIWAEQSVGNLVLH